MNYKAIPNVDVHYLNELLFDNNHQLKVVESSFLQSLPPTHIMIWGNKHGVYCFPTFDLIDWLRSEIGDQIAIEICSGNGAIGRALNITRTDSYIQNTPEMLAYYSSLGQLPTSPPSDVQKFEANEAVDHFKPQVVLGSYITQKYIDGDELNKTNSSIYGVDELTLFPKIEKYITIGNSNSHGDKRLRKKYPFKRYQFPWLFTRSTSPENNEIIVWSK